MYINQKKNLAIGINNARECMHISVSTNCLFSIYCLFKVESNPYTVFVQAHMYVCKINGRHDDDEEISS